MKATSTVAVEHPAKADEAFVRDLTADMTHRCARLAGMRPGQAISAEVGWRDDPSLLNGQLLVVTVTFPDFADPGTLTKGELA